jgi:hypothetical protein
MAKLAGGIALLMVSAFMLIGFMAGGAGTQSLGVRVFAFLITVGIPGAGGLALLRGHLRRSLPSGGGGADALRRQTWESEIVKLAERKGGKLTVVEVIADSVMNADDAEEVFKDLVGRGLAEPEVTDGGLIVYVFPDIKLLKEKNASKSLFDS